MSKRKGRKEQHTHAHDKAEQDQDFKKVVAVAPKEQLGRAGDENPQKDVGITIVVLNPFKKDGDIGFSALRSGGIWGEHEVMFAGSTEVVTIGSRALSREVFVNGALFAARWLSSITEPGLYLMQDIFKI